METQTVTLTKREAAMKMSLDMIREWCCSNLKGKKAVKIAISCQDPKNAKNILWQKLCKRYEEMLPLSKNLTTELYPDWEHMTYPDVNSRCEDFARQNIANSYLTHLNAGQQMIPPHLLMPYVEESINYLQSEYGKNEYREKVQFLKKVFIDLNADDSIVRNIQPQFKTEEEPVINENTETDLEK